MKILFSEEAYHGIPTLAAINISLEGLRHLAEGWEPIFRALLPLGQLLVAGATVVYIVRRTLLLKKRKEKEDEEL